MVAFFPKLGARVPNACGMDCSPVARAAAEWGESSKLVKSCPHPGPGCPGWTTLYTTSSDLQTGHPGPETNGIATNGAIGRFFTVTPCPGDMQVDHLQVLKKKGLPRLQREQLERLGQIFLPAQTLMDFRRGGTLNMEGWLDPQISD